MMSLRRKKDVLLLTETYFKKSQFFFLCRYLWFLNLCGNIVYNDVSKLRDDYQLEIQIETYVWMKRNLKQDIFCMKTREVHDSM